MKIFAEEKLLRKIKKEFSIPKLIKIDRKEAKNKQWVNFREIN